MRQMITRIDDGLHEELKARAAAEGRSVNSLVTEVLEAALERPVDRRARLRREAAHSGLLVVPPQPERVLPLDEVVALNRGSGRAVSEALAEDRDAR